MNPKIIRVFRGPLTSQLPSAHHRIFTNNSWKTCSCLLSSVVCITQLFQGPICHVYNLERICDGTGKLMALVIWKALWHTAKHQGSNTTPGLDTRVQGAGCVHASGSGDSFVSCNSIGTSISSKQILFLFSFHSKAKLTLNNNYSNNSTGLSFPQRQRFGASEEIYLISSTESYMSYPSFWYKYFYFSPILFVIKWESFLIPACTVRCFPWIFFKPCPALS